jgi:hypothetical protein
MSVNQQQIVSLGELQRYLLTHGWLQVDHPNKRITLFATKPDKLGDYTSIALPASAEFSDASELMRNAIRLIADYENLPIRKALDQVHRWDRDILRARMIKLRGHEDFLPLTIAAETISSLKEFIGYAAYTQSAPRPFFDKAGGEAAAFAEHCLFGHTFAGSFGLTVECPISVIPELAMPGNQPIVPLNVPFERQVFERVASGFSTLRISIEKSSLEPMIEGYKTGFSANMCHTLAEIFQQAGGRRIEYDISWSPELKSSAEQIWKPFLFEGRAHEFALAAATELEKVEKVPDSVIEGPIIVLKSDTPPGLDEQFKFEHVITMFWQREKEQTVQIRVPLSPQQYIEACDAHKEGRKIRILGIPEKSGKFWTLTDPHDFTVFGKPVK